MPEHTCMEGGHPARLAQCAPCWNPSQTALIPVLYVSLSPHPCATTKHELSMNRHPKNAQACVSERQLAIAHYVRYPPLVPPENMWRPSTWITLTPLNGNIYRHGHLKLKAESIESGPCDHSMRLLLSKLGGCTQTTHASPSHAT